MFGESNKGVKRVGEVALIWNEQLMVNICLKLRHFYNSRCCPDLCSKKNHVIRAKLNAKAISLQSAALHLSVCMSGWAAGARWQSESGLIWTNSLQRLPSKPQSLWVNCHVLKAQNTPFFFKFLPTRRWWCPSGRTWQSGHWSSSSRSPFPLEKCVLLCLYSTIFLSALALLKPPPEKTVKSQMHDNVIYI